ncbi:YfgM family protein [Zestomonas thermotolerans]|uniref:YfgM family protein n=1 Tax=Zestomonas thermotolerans TaxID=157784 RepID=UPI0023F441E4|nr:tetratricopeptide repeat protein [Pseudomonas thermotolerans]
MSRTEEEQLALIQDWWKRNGKPLLTGGVLALAAVFGWEAWQKYQTNQAQAASALYQQLLETTLGASDKPDVAKVSELAGKLKSDYGNTAYAQYASLFVAKVAVEAGKLDDAAAELQPVVAKPVNETLGELARQRLARVLSAQDKTEEALKLLDGQGPAAFQASRLELRGDLLAKLGRSDEARVAYEQAKAAMAEDAAVGALQMKLDDLAKGDA